MKILILGGTRFLGRHLATEVLSREHALTLFDPESEGSTDEHVATDLAELEEQHWDACLDMSTASPGRTAELVEALADRVGRYLYVSSVDVHLLDERETAEQDGEGRELRGHGARKQAVERLLEDQFRERLTVLRPGLLIGPHDTSGRFAYWVERALGGGEFLAPAPPDAAIQVTDVRDVASFAVDLAEREQTGAFDVVGPARNLAFGELLENLTHLAGELSSVTWVDNGFLLERDVRPWIDIPLWLTEEGPRSVASIDGSAAQAAGFAARPLDETLRDTLDWFAELGRETAAGAGFLDRERERQLLSEWHRGAALGRHPLAAGHEI